MTFEIGLPFFIRTKLGQVEIQRAKLNFPLFFFSFVRFRNEAMCEPGIIGTIGLVAAKFRWNNAQGSSDGEGGVGGGGEEEEEEEEERGGW